MSDFPSSSFANSQARGREWTVAAGVSLVVSLAVLAPFFKLGIASGHDVAFHMASWLDVAGQWKQGVLFPRWAEWANFGFGEPRFVFYPPLSWLFGALLGTIFPWQSVVVIFIVCTQTFAGLSAYSLTRRLTDSRFAALLGAACFVANPYALLIIYVRSDFAELLAIAFFPILLLATMRLTARFEHTEPPFFKKILLFSLGYSAIWLCNAPAAVIASYSVALLVLVAVLQQRSLRPAMKGAAGITLGFGLAAFYLIPAIYEQRWVNINGALAAGLAPAENFLYSHTSDADHDAFNHVASHLAVFLIFWAIVAATAAWRLESHKEKSHCDSYLFVSLRFSGNDSKRPHASMHAHFLAIFTRTSLHSISVALDVRPRALRDCLYSPVRSRAPALGLARFSLSGNHSFRWLPCEENLVGRRRYADSANRNSNRSRIRRHRRVRSDRRRSHRPSAKTQPRSILF